MLENRIKGKKLATIVSFTYLILAIIILLVSIYSFYNVAFLYNLSGGLVNIETLITIFTVYILFFAATLATTKKIDDNLAWKLYIAFAILSVLIIGANILIIILAILLIIAGYDVKQELSQ